MARILECGELQEVARILECGEQGEEEDKGEEQEIQFILETDTEPDIEIQNKKRKQNIVYLESGFEQSPPIMVFTVCSNEHTVKVIINSRNPRDDSVPYNLKFSINGSITCPANMVSMVCLESATILAPSMFESQLLNDSNNIFQRRIYVGDVNKEIHTIIRTLRMMIVTIKVVQI